ncbi:MAG: hypothetical protein ABSF89_02530 [Acidimicrobiales bacterium]
MQAEREELLRHLAELEKMTARLNDVTREALRRTRKVGSMLERGSSARGAISALVTADFRQRMSDCLSEYEDARRQVRVDLALLGRAEGMSVTELARQWGISRQLVARYLAVGKD